MNISTLFQFFNRHRKKPPIQKFDGNLYNLSTQTVHRHQKQHLIADRNFLSQNSWLPFNSEKKNPFSPSAFFSVSCPSAITEMKLSRSLPFGSPRPFWLEKHHQLCHYNTPVLIMPLPKATKLLAIFSRWECDLSTWIPIGSMRSKSLLVVLLLTRFVALFRASGHNSNSLASSPALWANQGLLSQFSGFMNIRVWKNPWITFRSRMAHSWKYRGNGSCGHLHCCAGQWRPVYREVCEDGVISALNWTWTWQEQLLIFHPHDRCR